MTSPRVIPRIRELLEDDEIDAVAVVLGHQLHHRLTIDSLKRGEARAGLRSRWRSTWSSATR